MSTPSWLAGHARFLPEHEALFDATSGRRWTYRQLHDDSLRWAALLRAEGVRRGDRVAVLAHNRGETFALLFACAELGAILFPMNWRLSVAELAWQNAHAEPKVIVAEASCATSLNGNVWPIERELGAERYEGPGAEPDDPWQLMYTSGSTGKPKGALLTHGQLLYNAVNTTLACDLTPQDSTLTFTPLFHTGGMNCLSTPLLHRGGRVVLTHGVEPESAFALIAQERVTLLMGVPTIYQMLADHPGFTQADLSSVRDALCGGAPLSLPLLERWLEREIPLRQGFGMTEVGPNCFSMPHDWVRRKLPTVGKPIHHVKMKVVDSAGRQLGPDEPGELLLGGPIVFGGYFRDPEATARALTEDGFFRSGDVVSFDEDGFATVRGRIKEMYISGGENVYPAEVEAVISRFGAVSAVAVVGVPDPQWGEVGHAFLEPAPGQQIDLGALSAFLQQHLARYKQPKKVVVREQLPRTASGKLDKVALRSEAAS
jgi:fatty-acyl-CoA synthase